MPLHFHRVISSTHSSRENYIITTISIRFFFFNVYFKNFVSACFDLDIKHFKALSNKHSLLICNRSQQCWIRQDWSWSNCSTYNFERLIWPEVVKDETRVEFTWIFLVSGGLLSKIKQIVMVKMYRIFIFIKMKRRNF